MAQIAKIEANAETKCPAQIFDIFRYNKSQFVNMLPHIFKSVQLLEGEEGQVANVMLFEYVLGKPMTVKVKTEEVNDGERSITFRAVEGEIMQLYSSFVLKVTASDDSVQFCFEFEKNIDSAPNPDNYAKLAVEVTKGMDLYFLTH